MKGPHPNPRQQENSAQARELRHACCSPRSMPLSPSEHRLMLLQPPPRPPSSCSAFRVSRQRLKEGERYGCHPKGATVRSHTEQATKHQRQRAGVLMYQGGTFCRERAGGASWRRWPVLSRLFSSKSATGHIDPRLPPMMVHVGTPPAPLLEGLLAEGHDLCRSGISGVADSCLHTGHLHTGHR